VDVREIIACSENVEREKVPTVRELYVICVRRTAAQGSATAITRPRPNLLRTMKTTARARTRTRNDPAGRTRIVPAVERDAATKRAFVLRARPRIRSPRVVMTALTKRLSDMNDESDRI
jgi:hypothetical protein